MNSKNESTGIETGKNGLKKCSLGVHNYTGAQSQKVFSTAIYHPHVLLTLDFLWAICNS